MRLAASGLLVLVLAVFGALLAPGLVQVVALKESMGHSFDGLCLVFVVAALLAAFVVCLLPGRRATSAEGQAA